MSDRFAYLYKPPAEKLVMAVTLRTQVALLCGDMETSSTLV